MREEAILGGQKFAALHESQVRAGTFLYVPRGVEIELPIEAFHWLHGANGSCFPHTLIIAEEMSEGDGHRSFRKRRCAARRAWPAV